MAPVLVKSLSRLSRSSLIDLALKWLQPSLQCQPYLACNRTINESEEEDYLFNPADDIEELKDLYANLQQDAKETSKGHIVDRIIDGDWRRGLSLQQLAMVDLAYLEEHDTALRWSAHRLIPRDEESAAFSDGNGPARKKRKLQSEICPQYPSISPSTFVAALKAEISPLVKAHYHLSRLPAPYNLPILRLYISPRGAFGPRYTSIPRPSREAVDPGRLVYIALPDSCPYIYISLSGSSGPIRSTSGARDKNRRVPAKVDMASMKRIILGAIPKAMSRPHERWALESTKLTTKSLESICELRGNGKPGTTGGAYTKFVTNEDEKMDTSPVEVITRPHAPPPSQQEASEHSDAAHQRQIQTRFGTLSGPHHAPLDRFRVTVSDVLRPSDGARSIVDAAPITLTFSGSDVFLGLKELAELGSECVDLDKVPSWMTGEMNVSSFTA